MFARSLVSLRPEACPEPGPSALIDMLRLSALHCRSAARRSPQAACALLHPEANAGDYADALARALPGLLRRRPRIWTPGTPGQSFDEAWLATLFDAIRDGDGASTRFLIERFARPGNQAILRFLLVGLVDRLDIS
ncbi:MAG: hypothetical protein WBA25_02660 [Jannaschia sp.]